VLHVDGLDGDRVGGAVLDVSGGSGARLHALSSIGAAGPALRLRGVRDAALDGLTSTGDAAALVADDVAGLHAAGVRARGNGLVLGGRGLELVAPDVDAPVEALRAVAGAVVTVTGGTLRGGAAAVDAEGRVHLRGVAAHGPVRGPVRRTPAAAVPASAAWWDRPVRGTGAVVLVVLVAAAVLEVLRGRVRPDAGGGGAAAPPPPADADLVLDLGEAWD
jgi:hypothetical protein